MRTAQAEQISHMRRMGNSYGQIADSLGLPLNTVKSFCRRRCITAESGVSLCECCGVEVKQTEHRKVKRFCSDTCRTKWWSAHQHLFSRTSRVPIHCQYCGRKFTDYATAGRKYCSHDHDIPWMESRDQNIFQISQKFILCCSALKGRKRHFSIQSNGRQNGSGLRRIQRHMIYHTPAAFFGGL